MTANENIPTKEEIESVIDTFARVSMVAETSEEIKLLVDQGRNVLYLAKQDRQTLINVIIGDHDLQIAANLFYLVYGYKPQSFGDLDSLSSEVIELKRKLYNRLFAKYIDEQQPINKRFRIRDNQPHQAGTTEEIAATTGLSKKKVRRLKRDGELDQYLDN